MSEETKENMAPTEPSIMELSNEPFMQKIDGKEFNFRRLGMGRTLAVVGKHIERRLIRSIGDRASAFEDKDAKVSFVNAELSKLPKSRDISQLAVHALVGDQEFIDSDGKNGNPPNVDEEILKDLIERSLRSGKPQELKEAVESMPLDQMLLLVYRIVGISSERDQEVKDIGGTPEKKD